MTNAFKRGTASGRARSEEKRPGSFKKGQQKRGGRQRGTPNIFSAEYKKHILEAVYRVGEDGNGKSGLIGYGQWVALYHPEAACRLLEGMMKLEELETGWTERPRLTVEELDEELRASIGLGSDERTQPEFADPGSAIDPTGRKDRTLQQAECAQPASTRKRDNCKPSMQKQTQPPDPESPWAWTGIDSPVGALMHMAITDPIEFCTLFQAAFLRPTARQRELWRARKEGLRGGT